MEPDFWHERWKLGQTGFHQDAVHDDLVQHANWLLGGGPKRLLVPLCGKSRDLHWAGAQGHRVTGVELSPVAARAMYQEQGLPFDESSVGPFGRVGSTDVSVLTGDVFALQPDILRSTLGDLPDRLWDRAALVALRPDQRPRYLQALRRVLAPGARVLLNSLVYDPTLHDGPPWSVDEPEVRALWEDAQVDLVDRVDVLEQEPRWKERGHQWFRRDLYHITLPDPT